ncbi:hypothetical protein GCM10010919_27300 [Alishewanella longhuensis]|uniref:Uncharacterized protein n=1 Tax=Alishewanella longhuensis TaxID=1091037 RepID=A0ABQ3L0R9_9ALTE|nr:hypothetical protein [Alishewanella longhuensis]GHG73985.1 hypothetical protein GCM10010919_27300 [Alishewanella longhuensis]
MKWLILISGFFWSNVFALCPPLLPDPVRVSLKHQQQNTVAEIAVAELESGMQQLQLRLLQRHMPLASLDLLLGSKPLQVQASPLVEDSNLDGFADHVWFISTEGILWRFSILEGVFSKPQLMADLSDSGLDFIATAALLRTRLPSSLAPLAWRHADQQLLLLVARDRVTGHDSILMLRFSMGPSTGTITRFAHLADRTLINETAQSQALSAADWRALLSRAGWQVQLPGKISTAPKVVAGVIYAAVASTHTADDCVPRDNTQQLYAMHLHTAASVYNTLSQQIPYLPDAALALQQQANKQLKLVLRSEQQQTVIKPNLLKISAECHNCTEPLSLDKFPLWKRLATYRNERGAY